MKALRRFVAAIGLLGLAVAAQAHKPSDSYLTLKVDGSTLTGHWDIALRDLDFALGLDADGDGNITWGEVRARHAEIAAYAAARLALLGDGQNCALNIGVQQVDSHTDGAYSVLPLKVSCPATAAGTDPKLPATLALVLGAGVRRWLPGHLFIYIMGRGFFVTWIAAAGAGALALAVTATPVGTSLDDLLLARFLTASGEAFLTGMLTAIFVAFRPQWLATYSDRLYLPQDGPGEHP